jgi:hypothetical protein
LIELERRLEPLGIGYAQYQVKKGEEDAGSLGGERGIRLSINLSSFVSDLVIIASKEADAV